MFGWFRQSPASAYVLNDILTGKEEFTTIDPGEVYGVREIVDCQKKYDAGCFCATENDMALKCLSGNGDLKKINDANIYAFCNSGGRYCLRCTSE